MERKKAIEFIQKILVSNEGKKPDEQLQRKDIVDILVVDHKVPESTAYRHYADAVREYEWEQEKSGDPTRIDKNKKVLDFGPRRPPSSSHSVGCVWVGQVKDRI